MPASVWSDWLADTASERTRLLWRGVEAQHLVATMKLIDSLAEQRTLEQLLDRSKPPLPEHGESLHYLLSTPFRYRSPHPSRFRSASAPGRWYGAETRRTACAEIAFWRWRFVQDSEGLAGREVISEHTLFQARARGSAIDLSREPWSGLAARWSHPSDYRECQQLADAAADAGVQWIRYRSARLPGGYSAVVLDAAALSLPQPLRQQTWVCKLSGHAAVLAHEHEGYRFVFA